MIVAALAYAKGDGAQPRELEMAQHIATFGAPAVVGRVLSLRELRQMTAAQNIVRAHRSRAAADDWGKWAETHREQNALLMETEAIYYDRHG